jgi:uncharacterized membrane protein
MNQDEINQNEWSDPKNWSLLSYSSRLDSRLFVPKRRGFGETMNFGHKKARIASLTFMGLILSSLIFALVDIAIKH